jgi:tetratricopeptide (TPR) repeat protein
MSFGFRWSRTILVIAILTSLSRHPSTAQVSRKVISDRSSSAQNGITLVEAGRCKEALPILEKVAAALTDKQLKYRAAMALTRCAMSLNKTETAVHALLLLRREYPTDPEVLYITTHYYSELANRASQELAATASSSYQAHKLEAEAFESQGKWDEAAAEYKNILSQNPQLPNIHFRLGQVLLARPATATTEEDAKKEFREELRVNPSNAAAEFVLGEFARRGAQWGEAIEHFSRATKLDEGFAEAFLALGMSLNSAAKYSDAVAPLENYVAMLPSDPAGHYQLATSYSRMGRKQDADREMALQRETAARNQKGSAPDPSSVR